MTFADVFRKMSAARSSAVGKVLFGSLTATTFGLGAWQTARFLEEKPEPEKVRIKAEDLDPSRAVWVGPRNGGPSNKRGYFAYVPDDPNALLVCLGWTNGKPNDLSALKSDLRGEFVAFTRPGERGNSFSPPNPLNGPFLWMDQKQMLSAARLDGEKAKLADVYDSILPGAFAPKARPEPYLTKWTHAGYAVTWYSLSVAGIIMMRRMFR